MADSIELTDGRIVVRTPIEDDAPRVAAAVQASLAQLSPWMPWATDAYDDSMALAWIRDELEQAPTVPLVIVDEAGTIVGSTGLNRFDDLNKRANLGYWIRTDAAGTGLATAATRLVARHGIDTLGLQRIEIMMSVENEASRRVAEKAGAVYEGVLRNRLRLQDRQHDVHCFAVFPDTVI